MLWLINITQAENSSYWDEGVIIILSDYIIQLQQNINDLFEDLKLDCTVEIHPSKWGHDANSIDFFSSYGGVKLHRLGYSCTLDVSQDTQQIVKSTVWQLLEYHSSIIIKLDNAFASLNGEEPTSNYETYKSYS